jgi:two-component sensor histidine kinase
VLSRYINKKLRIQMDKKIFNSSTKIWRVITWFQRTYPVCPPSLALIALFQFVIISMYIVLDALKAVSDKGGGYSTIFAAIPVVYMLLYSDSDAQIQGRKIIFWVLSGVVVIQLGAALLYWTQPSQLLIVTRDVITILLISVGTIGGVLWIMSKQHIRHLPSRTQQALDAAFNQTSRADFWSHLTSQIADILGTEEWLWIQSEGDSWKVLYITVPECLEWLQEPKVCTNLAQNFRHDPYGISIYSLDLPKTIMILPINQIPQKREFLLTSNPSGSALQVLYESILFRRILMAAQSAIIMDEHHRFAIQQQDLAHRLQLFVNASIHNQSEQIREDRARNMELYTIVHDIVLFGLDQIYKELEKLDDKEINERYQEIATNLRIVFRDLYLHGQEVDFILLLEEHIRSWERKNPSIIWIYRKPEDIPQIAKIHQVAVFLIVKQAIDNAIRHASAKKITVKIKAKPFITIEVHDDGCGFDLAVTEQKPTSLGLLLMYGLADYLKGELSIHTQVNAGCKILLKLPDTQHIPRT